MTTFLIWWRWVCELVCAGVCVFFYLPLAENRNWEDWSHGSRSALLEAAPLLSLSMFLLSKAHQPRSSPVATEWTNVARYSGSTPARIYCTLQTGTFISGCVWQFRSRFSECCACNLGCPSASVPSHPPQSAVRACGGGRCPHAPVCSARNAIL